MYGAECCCVAGLGECCSHVAAVLFSLDDSLSRGKSCIPEDVSCTDTPCSWIAPANSAKVQPEPIHNVLVYKPVLGKEKPAANETTLQDFHPIPLADIKASPMLVGELVADLRHRNPTCPFVTMFSAQTYVETTYSTSLPSLPEFLPDVFDFCDMAPSAEVCINTSDGAVTGFSSPGEAAVQGFLDMRRLVQATGSLVTPTIHAALEPSPQHARHVEQHTRGQSINNQWYYHRVGRISSSRSHQIGHIRDATDRGPILDTIFGCTDRSSPAPVPTPHVQTAAMAHGLNMEHLARREYIQEKKNKGTPVSVVATGLLISTEHPWLAMSPDGLVSDDSANDRFGVLEIKCPFLVSQLKYWLLHSCRFVFVLRVELCL